MPGSRTRYFRNRNVPSDPALRAVLIRLMTFVNDVAIAADANDNWAQEEDPKRAPRKDAARMYFIRILMSHVHEGFEIIKDLSDNKREYVERCGGRILAEFEKLEKLKTSHERGILNRFRQKTGFHYDDEIPEEHLENILNEHPDSVWRYSVGSSPLDWNFQLADDVIARIVVRHVFGLDEPRSARRHERIGELSSRLDRIASDMTGFATDFATHYLR